MQFFNKIAIVAMFTAFVAAKPVPETDKRQLPSIVCLTDVLSNLGSGLLDVLDLTILDCSTGETCTALGIPIVGDLLPIGVSLAARSHKAGHELINLLCFRQTCQ
ncbi:hypothetical protein ACEPAI_8539 [Sanghuangporus weigelae]